MAWHSLREGQEVMSELREAWEAQNEVSPFKPEDKW